MPRTEIKRRLPVLIVLAGRRVSERLVLRQAESVLGRDAAPDILVSDELHANPDDLLSKGIDLQLEAAVVLLKSRAEGHKQAQAMIRTDGSGA